MPLCNEKFNEPIPCPCRILNFHPHVTSLPPEFIVCGSRRVIGVFVNLISDLMTRKNFIIILRDMEIVTS